MSDDIANAELSEIDVTPEMIKVGALALYEHDMQTESLEEGAVRSFRTMLRVSPSFANRS